MIIILLLSPLSLMIKGKIIPKDCI
jgi:hypothetical protein